MTNSLRPFFIAVTAVAVLAAQGFSDAPANPSANNVVAKVGSVNLTDADLQKDLGMSLYETENQLYQMKKNWIDQKAKEILFNDAAKRAGLSRQQWQKKEIDDVLQAPSQQDI